MRRRASLNDNVGGRIFREENNNDALAPSLSSSLSSNVKARGGDDKIEVEPQASAQQVLDCLDWQINLLNETKRINKYHHEQRNCKRNFIATGEDSIAKAAGAKLKYWRRRHSDLDSSNSSRLRKLALDRYLRQTLKCAGECGCHFKHNNLSNQNLHSYCNDSSNNHFGKFESHSASSSLRNYYLVEENSHLSKAEAHPYHGGTTLHANNPSFGDPSFQNQQQQLAKLKLTTSAKQLSRGLLIDESGEDCTGGAVVAAGGRRDETPATGKPQALATGNSQSASRQGLSQAADLQFYGNKSATFKPLQRSLVTCKTNHLGSTDCTISRIADYEWDCEEEFESEVGSALAGLHGDADDDVSEKEVAAEEENYTKSGPVFREPLIVSYQCQTHCSLTDSSTFSLSWAQDDPLLDSKFHVNSNLNSSDIATKNSSRRAILEGAPPGGSSISRRSYLCNKRTDSELIREPNDDDERSPAASSASSNSLELGHYNCNYSLDGFPTASLLSTDETLEIAIDAGSSKFINNRDTNYKASYRSLSVEQEQGVSGNYIHHLHHHSNDNNKFTGRIRRNKKRNTLIAASSESGSELLLNHSSSLLLSSSEDNGEAETLRGGKRKRRSQPIGKAEKSMKAAKDIAKLSIPSLSSLQYLPSHLDVSKRKNLHRRRRERKLHNQSCKMALRVKASNEISNKKLTNDIGAESCENINHEHQGLFSRLCLSCNCATRACDLQPNENSEQDASKKKKRSRKSASECQLNVNSGRDLASSHKSPSKSEKLRTSSCSSSADARREPIRARKSPATAEKQQFNKPIEKQSPSFLNILKSSGHTGQKLESQTVEKVDASREHGFTTHRNVIQSGVDVDEYDEDENLDEEIELGSASESSRNYSNESRSNSLTSGPQSSSVERNRQQRQRHQQQQNFTSCNSPPPTPDDLSSQPTRPQSVGSDRVNDKAPKGFTLRRYLTPTRFFSISPSSKSGLSSYHDANLDKRRISSPTAEPRGDLSESFFTRSLNRISGKRRKQKEQQAIDVDDNLIIKTDNIDKSLLSSDSYLKNQSTCVSPTISNISSLHKDSLKSLDQEIELPPFPQLRQKDRTRGKPVYLAPEIVFSKVEYSNSESKSDTRQYMGRLNSNHHGHLSNLELEGQGEDEDYNYLANDGHHRARYGSDAGNGELSINVGAGERAFSLPSSPCRARRQRSPGAPSRSPRLTHSPVPFQSPITQSTKIEDGLQVCSSEHFEKHIGNIKGGQLEAQKKLFQAWINHYSPHLIQHDLVDELKDGIKLIGLLASLTRDKKLLVQYEKLNQDKQSLINRLVVTPTSRLQHLCNVSIAIDYMRKQIGMKLINLNPMDVVSGRPNVILGLCWNIILHFQLEQNFLRYFDSCDASSLSSSIEDGRIRGSTSRLSVNATNEDSDSLTKSRLRGLPVDQLEEFTLNDLAKAKRKLLEHINKRFSLKLTHLTSSLLDGDALLIIIKQLLDPGVQLPQELGADVWAKLSNDAKLDACFEFAQEHLNVPRLFSASDLRQQSISDNTSKPLLVYLSMLLDSNQPTTSTRKGESDSSSSSTVPQDQHLNHEKLIREYLEQIKKPDSFSLSNLQSTLTRIKKVEELLANNEDNHENMTSLDLTLVADCKRAAHDAARVETLISWINKADSLFDKTQRSSDLNKALGEFRNFFSPLNVPDITGLSLCSTLERQYRECLNTTKQKVLSLEQAIKNRVEYERAKRHLKDWLTMAESKLVESLQPIQSIPEANIYDPMEHHKACLENLIEFFELEPFDSILANELYAQDNKLDSDQFQNDESLSSMGSVLSLNSTSSRMSFQSSRKASYYGLFDDFELKSRLLATQLDVDQKESLMLGARELKHKLRYIMEQRVPQVVNELRFNIIRMNMFIDEDQNRISLSNKQLNNQGELEGISESILPTDNGDNELALASPESKLNDEELQTTRKSNQDIKNDIDFHMVEEAQSNRVKSITKTHKSHNFEKESISLSQEQTACESKPLISWSLLNWLFESDSDAKSIMTKQTKNSKKSRRLGKSQKSRAVKSPSRSTSKKTPSGANDKIVKEVDNDSDGEAIPLARVFWNKLIRATKASMPLNIVLLICLAGFCLVPLVNKNACCELSQTHISSDEFSMHEKPT